MKLLIGDCLERLKELADNSVDSIVTDPPAGISFMGQDWDGSKGGRDSWIAWMQSIAAECLRVVKPGGHAIVWALPRTSHWTATAWENVGFEMRDSIVHIFGSGFPKSANLGIAADKILGNDREVAEKNPLEGWGTGLKPAHENWLLLRKPIDKGLSIAANALKHGTGGINIDGCKIGTEEWTRVDKTAANSFSISPATAKKRIGQERKGFGRYPANLIHDGSEEVVAIFPDSKGTSGLKRKAGANKGNGFALNSFKNNEDQLGGFNDSGSAARFFYCTKASKADRDEGCEGLPIIKHKSGMAGAAMPVDDLGNDRDRFSTKSQNHHPTVKNTRLMIYLCRLITPPNGIVLDPFMGSGSTGKAAILEGFDFIGIEQNAEFFKIAQARITHAQQELELTI